ncbi:hypothetical protein G6L28_15125 [Agrobacterium larrymoorei]|uniref:hypothetical protein n=1 Tax=Agrobacterium larrymoorei TaxID=160699 RepID=UPI0015735276|nr:hypothetical protein [Agrobacterium larrymoorei]NTJ43931.1 hypothetical protein [Agrobacterium larrymoorei]
MSASQSPSPAVSSLHHEQARQRTDDAPLEEALKDTFPASDPVSQASTTTATTTTNHDVQSEDAPMPKVDEALEAVRARHATDEKEYSIDEIKAMRAEVKSLLTSAQELASASGQIARTEIRSVRHNLAYRVRKHPLPAVGLAALVGYLWGLSR